MMGTDHALSGALVGSAVVTVARFSGHPTTLTTAAVIILATAGYALWPDIDHPSATAARAFGPLSHGLATALNWLGEAVFAITSGRRDKPRRDGHRTITHTLVFAITSGIGAYALARAWPYWGALVLLFVGFSLAGRGLAGDWAKRNGWLVLSAVAAALAFLAMLVEPNLSPELLGVAVALGSFTHCLGDSCTLAGCPWLWPIPIAGQAWYPIGTPQFLRFRTGTEEYDGEDYLRVLMWIGLVALALAHVPGLYPWLGDRAAALWSTVVA